MTSPLTSPLDFAGKAVIVTGGTRGIGRGITDKFLASGADVLICGRNEPDDLPAVDGRSALFMAADVRDAQQAQSLVHEAVNRFGRLDVLINNAGGSPSGPADSISPKFVEKIIALNLTAPFFVAQAANSVMQQQESGGAIVNIGSFAAHVPAPLTAPYAAAKAGLLQLTKALALEWSPRVRVNHITTGLIFTEQSGEHYGPDGGAAVARTIPMGRMAVPGDVADACLYLASGLASYVTGADLAVHGGGQIPAWYIAAGHR